MLDRIKERRARNQALNHYRDAIRSGMDHTSAQDYVLEKMQAEYGNSTDRRGIEDWISILQILFQLLEFLRPLFSGQQEGRPDIYPPLDEEDDPNDEVLPPEKAESGKQDEED